MLRTRKKPGKTCRIHERLELETAGVQIAVLEDGMDAFAQNQNVVTNTLNNTFTVIITCKKIT